MASTDDYPGAVFDRIGARIACPRCAQGHVVLTISRDSREAALECPTCGEVLGVTLAGLVLASQVPHAG